MAPSYSEAVIEAPVPKGSVAAELTHLFFENLFKVNSMNSDDITFLIFILDRGLRFHSCIGPGCVHEPPRRHQLQNGDTAFFAENSCHGQEDLRRILEKWTASRVQHGESHHCLLQHWTAYGKRNASQRGSEVESSFGGQPGHLWTG